MKKAGSLNYTSPISSQAEREQALRDYKLTIEYKHLKQHSPGGVYVVPSHDSLRHFHGVIFVRRGPFCNGIFKFQIKLPDRYNDTNTCPIITFSSYVYNPHVDMETGEVDIKRVYPKWDPHKNYLITVLTYVKKIFYVKTFSDDTVANIEARDLARTNRKEYLKKVTSCVNESQRSVFVNDPGSTTKFSEDQLCHQLLRENLSKHAEDPSGLSRSMILDMVGNSRRKTEKVTYA